MRSYGCYLFDLDGTLLDTVDLICESYRHLTLKILGKAVGRSEVVPLIGIPLKEQFRRFFTGLDVKDLDSLVDQFMEYQYKIYRDYLKVFPAVPETLSRLKQDGAVMGIVTSRRKASTETYLTETGIRGYFDVLVTPVDTARHTPDAAPVLKALQLLDRDPSDTLVVGDAEFDIVSGRSAGTDTAFALWGINDPGKLPVAPTWLLGSMSDLLNSGDGRERR